MDGKLIAHGEDERLRESITLVVVGRVQYNAIVAPQSGGEVNGDFIPVLDWFLVATNAITNRKVQIPHPRVGPHLLSPIIPRRCRIAHVILSSGRVCRHWQGWASQSRGKEPRRRHR